MDLPPRRLIARAALVVLLGVAALAVQWAGASRPPAVPDCPRTDTGIVVEVDAEGVPTGRAVGVVRCHE